MTLEMRLEGDTQIVAELAFAAPPTRVYAAHVEPDLLRKWMLGPPGWSMPVCVWEARPGGRIHCQWQNGGKASR